MNIEETLQASGIDRIDAEVLMAHLLHKPREWLITHATDSFSHPKWESVVKRRLQREPVAYITGTQEFYGRDFAVDNRVLIPRPSTERLIDLLLDILADPQDTVRLLDTDVVGIARLFGDIQECTTVADVCTGSGCIAVTLACETTKNIMATDISKDALCVARKNAEDLGVAGRIRFVQGDLLEPLSGITEPFIVISNPPYIPDREELMPDVQQFEPNIALFGGPDGSDTVVTLYNSCKNHPYCRGLIIECRQSHIDMLRDIP